MDPQQQPSQSPPAPATATATANRPHSAPAGREDCWSEGASKILVDAWGERYLQLNRGNLRQKDWKQVAEAVNSRNDAVKPPRTDVQCKNRIDTLKKKYKLEKSRPSASKWLFYNRLDYLIGNSSSAATGSASKASAAPPLSTSIIPDRKPSTTVTLTIKPRSKLNTNRSSPNQYSGATSNSKSNGSSLGGDDDDDDAEFVRVSRKQKMNNMELSEETPYRELARAILRFGEIYERIESSKQEQFMELEKQRMEFTKDLEFQRMNMFTEAHLQLEKSKKKKKKKKPIDNHTPGSGEFSTLNT